MANFNKVFLMGNLTRDPQLSYLPSQTAVVDFGLAVNRRWTGRDGEKREETCFVDCQAFGRQAENINKYMSKGRALFVEGRLTFNSWTTQDGTKRSRHKVTVENFQFLGASGERGFGEPPPDAKESESRPFEGQGEQGGTHFASEGEMGPESSDDIPF